MAKKVDDKKLDLCVDVQYLGCLDVESKYLHSSIIPWLIAQVKLIETDKRIQPALIDVNTRKNTLLVYKHSSMATEEILNHRLTDIFKLNILPNDPLCFAYFYRKNNTSFNYYTLHVFYSNKSNLCKVLLDFQTQALKIHENLLYEKLFDFKLVTKLVITQEELNIPNFIEICLDKANTNNNNFVSSKILKNKNEAFLNLLSEKRVLIKFGPNRLYLQESDKEPIEQEYKNVLYLNNSITNENFFCLAYSASSLYKTEKSLVNALILYSQNVEVIDDVIREYAINVSSELNVIEHKINLDESLNSSFKLEKHSCEYCPMQQFVDLCDYLDKFNDRHDLIYDTLIDKLNSNLDQKDQNFIADRLNTSKLNFTDKTKLLNDSNKNSLIEANQLLVALIYKLCKNRQNQSTHSNFNLMINNNGKYLTLGNCKQSKSLHSNLAGLNKKRIQRSNTLDSIEIVPIMDQKNKKNFNLGKIFIDNYRESRQHANANFDYNSSKISFKRIIFNKIVGSPPISTSSHFNSGNHEASPFRFKRFKSSYEIKQFWKKVISEQIILIKMEKENRKMSIKAKFARENAFDRNNKANFNYIEITPCLKEVDKVWQSWLMVGDATNRPSLVEIKNTVFKGIPQSKREKIWFWLMSQYKSRNPHIGNKNCGLRTHLLYRELLNQTTIHQHAILLDLGRTFPTHVNFSKKFGSGQLSLFNVLKAYSILDSEVGYCQGLSFIVGILLIHVNNDEEKAFDLLKFLLIDLNFREQYKPDMIQLQKHMYQFTRLLHDTCFDIYSHFENNDISSSLYAAPWFLTLFSSQFQIGFVARVFDYLFAEGPLSLFKLSLAILSIHKPLLQSCDTFESIVNHIKTTIPEMSLIESEMIINKAFAYEDSIKDELYKYEIEFNFLYEEFSMSQNNCVKSISEVNVNSLESDNNRLKKELKDVKEKLQLLQLQINNQDEHYYRLHYENKQLKCKVVGLEAEKSGILKRVKEQEKLISSLID